MIGSGLKKEKKKKSAVVVVDRFYVVLFSAVKQTHCALVVCDSE